MKNHRLTGRASRPLRLTVLLAGAVALLLAACGTTPQTTWEPRSEFAIELKDLFSGILGAGAAVFVVVEAALIFAAIRFRRRPGDGLPPQIHGNTLIEVAWTTVPAVILAFILLPTVQTIFKTQAPAPAGALQINLIAHQFWWEFEYPELGVRTANEVHMPLGRTASFALRSADVVHSFWIPSLGGTRDVNPSHTNHVWWTPNTPGTFPGQCKELCGYSHANMRMRAMVQPPAEFDAWVAQQRQPAATPTDGAAAQGAQLFLQRGCAGCHTVNGTPAQARVGPDLTHVGSRTTIAAGVLENTPEGLRTWLHDPPGVKPGALMPNLNLNDDDLSNLVAYLQSLT